MASKERSRDPNETKKKEKKKGKQQRRNQHLFYRPDPARHPERAEPGAERKAQGICGPAGRIAAENLEILATVRARGSAGDRSQD